ncbi:ba6e927e-dfe2-4ec7-aa57-a27d465c8e43 [Thermothielavioides terrestris]|uniref:Ba6e927e-dfe2-4ec7-aa57-a27d465c8e43 n=1 Tax=Thermothielavioides terrestris TaxID=2587410 RepID=A0A3S4C9T5_9PEZI|nr:ba6e927e-dfe2-4ec7-aa57-a27d465c8e43 [Thermothielavioides terrestris]
MSVPPTPTATAAKSARQPFVPLVCVVDFHHARGPEVETWFGVDEGRDPAAEYDWTLLPFMALSDGAHALTENFSYFTLLRPATDSAPATSLFGISCTRQIDAAQLLVRPADVTRSTVQKAVVVIADSPQYFGMLRERLSVVTKAWFAQREFTDVEILRRFQESLADEQERGLMHEDQDRDQYLGLSLRELPKMLFFGTRCERLCLTQFSLISLIPGLLRNLQDSAGPDLDSYEKSLSTPTSLKTSDRNSLLAYMGLPLQIFGKGSLFGPYTPLQQLDILADFGTKSYIVGSTNSLLLQQKDRYSDILINLDEGTINITSPSLRAALQLSTPDRRWIDFITQNVNDTWDDANPSRPKTMGYVGSEEFIRLQFEEYLLSLISAAKYHTHLAKHAHNPRLLLPEIDGDPSHDFGQDFIEAWSRTENYRIWNSHTDSDLFNIVEPKHPCAGGLTIDDIQRRITQQVQDLHLDERFAQGREALGRNLAAGREKASTLLNKLYADVEAVREAQRKRAEEARAAAAAAGGHHHHERNGGGAGVDLAKAHQTMQAVGSKAGAFVNSWAAWAGEKRKGWGRSTAASSSSSSNSSGDNSSTTTTTTTTTAGNGGIGGWASGWVKSSKNRASQSQASAWSSDAVSEKEPRISTSSGADRRTNGSSDRVAPEQRPLNRGSVSGESMLDGAGSESALSSPVASPTKKPPPLVSPPLVSTADGHAAETPVVDGVLSAAVAGSDEGQGEGLSGPKINGHRLGDAAGAASKGPPKDEDLELPARGGRRRLGRAAQTMSRRLGYRML